MGSQFRHGQVFPKLRFDSGQPGFSGPVESFVLSMVSLPIGSEGQALVRVRSRHMTLAYGSDLCTQMDEFMEAQHKVD
jgi:hypothetical protein